MWVAHGQVRPTRAQRRRRRQRRQRRAVIPWLSVIFANRFFRVNFLCTNEIIHGIDYSSDDHDDDDNNDDHDDDDDDDNDSRPFSIRVLGFLGGQSTEIPCFFVVLLFWLFVVFFLQQYAMLRVTIPCMV